MSPLPHSLSQSCIKCVKKTKRLGTRRSPRLVLLESKDSRFGWPWRPFHGGELAKRGNGQEGIKQIRHGLAALRALGADIGSTYYVGLLAEQYGKTGQAAEGLAVLAEAFSLVEKNRERWWEAELYRLKGELLLAQEGKEESQKSKACPEPFGYAQDKLRRRVKAQKAKVLKPKSQILNPAPQGEAEGCFHKALEIARKQQAKSLELRATVSLARLWQQQGRKEQARRMLADIYGWFTAGFDTKELQEVKARLETLSD